ncbi:MAG: YebG family protein [Ectothiorhodospiraceae bacterium]|nr:YebG family protein [Ectothiorhodospiraceae bacterium]
MTVIAKYYSDKDPKETMFDDKAKADAHDRKLEAIESFASVLMDSASYSSVSLEEDDAYKMAEHMLDQHKEQMISIVTGKKARKPRENPSNTTDADADNTNTQSSSTSSDDASTEQSAAA